jgi:hypothetical protein
MAALRRAAAIWPRGHVWLSTIAALIKANKERILGWYPMPVVENGTD